MLTHSPLGGKTRWPTACHVIGYKEKVLLRKAIAKKLSIGTISSYMHIICDDNTHISCRVVFTYIFIDGYMYVCNVFY